MNDNLSLILINSIWYKDYENREILEEDTWVQENLGANYCLEKLFELRSIFLDILRKDMLQDYMEALNKMISQSSYFPRLDYDQGSYSISWKNEGALESKIILDFFKLISSDYFSQIKTCQNDQCHYFFIDYSKNHSKKFCSSRCSNYVKVKRFRNKDK
jgi:predicted RNA-binding Zn ribbon-like protein